MHRSLDGKLVPGVSSLERPAARARFTTAARSGSNASESRWQCVSVSTASVLCDRAKRSLPAVAARLPEVGLSRLQAGDLESVLQDRLHFILVCRLAIDAHNGLG